MSIGILENLNVYAPFTSSTYETFMNDLKNFLAGLDWFSDLDMTIEDVSVSGSTRTNLNLLAEPLNLKFDKIVLTYGYYYPYWKMYVKLNDADALNDSALLTNTERIVYTLRTARSSMVIMDASSNKEHVSPNFNYVFIGIIKVKNIITGAYEDALLVGNSVNMYISTRENTSMNINTMTTDYEYDSGPSYILKPFICNNYIYDEMFIIYNGPTITDDVVKINDVIYLNIIGHLFIKVN